MKIIDCIQGSPFWFDVRRGIPSASNFDRIITAKTMKPSAQQDDYVAELIAELSGLTPPWIREEGGIPNAAMKNGTNYEPEARRFYEFSRNVEVQQVGFCVHDCGHYGCSPDGLIGEDGGLELKCPLLKTQARYLIDGGLPSDYRAQVHGALLVTGREWWDFMSYAPGLEPLIIRVVPDEFTEALAAALDKFWDRYQECLHKLHPEVAADREAVTEWLTLMGEAPSWEALNDSLPQLAVLSPRAKRQVWNTLKEAAARDGLAFDFEAKRFLPRPSATF